MIMHTADCLAQQKRYEDWIARWPNACKKCSATGIIHDPGVYRYPDGSGDPPSDDPCEQCTAKINPEQPDDECCAYCPRCATFGLDITTDESACATCGWAWGRGADDYMPEVECCCYEVLVSDHDEIPFDKDGDLPSVHRENADLYE